MDKKRKLLLVWMMALWIVLLAAAVGGATYAWFSFNSATNVEPISSTVSSGEIALLIANDPAGEFSAECILPDNVSGELKPLSTDDLENFYAALAQNREGITTTYRNASDEVDDSTIHGTLYLKSLNNDCDVYLYRPGMDFGQEGQMLAALRLGLEITTESGAYTYIFELDDMGNTGGASEKRTTSEKNVVVSGISSGGKPSYTADPARAMGRFFAVPGMTVNDRPQAGSEALCRLKADEVAKVEYRLYLEGCDVNCYNVVQDKDAYVQLSFAGVRPAE